MRPLVLAVLAFVFGYAGGHWKAIPPNRPTTAISPAASTSSFLHSPTPSKPLNSATPAAQAHDDNPASSLRSIFLARNPLETAPRAVAAIEALTAEDFRKMAADPGSFPAPYVNGVNQVAGELLADALVLRWFAVDATGAATGIAKLEEALKKSHLVGAGTLLKALARTKPELRLDDVLAKKAIERFDMSVPLAFASLAKRDLAAAHRYAEQLTDLQERRDAEGAIGQGVAELDPLAGVRLARTLGNSGIFESALTSAERGGEEKLREVLTENAGKFPVGLKLTELVLRHPDLDWQHLAPEEGQAVRGIPPQAIEEAARLSPAERDRRLVRLDSLSAPLRANVAQALIGAWAVEDPNSAAEWALAHTDATDPAAVAASPARIAFYSWLNSDPGPAIARLSSLPSSPLKELLANNAAASLAAAGQVEQAQALLQPGADASSSAALASITARRAEADPSAAAQWLASVPPTADTTKAVGALLEKWLGADPAKAADWVEAQPSGPRREAALKAYTRAAADLDPSIAGECCKLITDSGARSELAEFVFRKMSRQDPPAARAWLRSIAGIDAGTQERLIQSPQ